MEKINKSQLLNFIVLSFIGILSWVAGNFVVNKFNEQSKQQEQIIEKQEQIANIKEERVSDYPDYEAIKGENVDTNVIRSIKITEECPPDGCVNRHAATVDFDGISKKYKATGKFSRAYLYAELLVDYDKPLTSWDDLYFTINNQGGHLIPGENNLPTPPSETTRYLYNLQSISYYPTIKDKNARINKRENIDFFYFLENESNISIWASISSNRPGRVMKEVSIYYQCFESTECSIDER